MPPFPFEQDEKLRTADRAPLAPTPPHTAPKRRGRFCTSISIQRLTDGGHDGHDGKGRAGELEHGLVGALNFECGLHNQSTLRVTMLPVITITDIVPVNVVSYHGGLVKDSVTTR